MGHVAHSQSRSRWKTAGLGLVAGAAAGAFAMAAASPSAKADTVDLPELPSVTDVVDGQSSALVPFYVEQIDDVKGSYTDLLGDDVTTTASHQPISFTDLYIPSNYNPTFTLGSAYDPNGIVAVLPTGDVGGSSISVIGPSSAGFVNFYESTPVLLTATDSFSQNVNDVFVFSPDGINGDVSDIAFGIQYLDLPDAATPVDEINLLGQAGEILLSIPVVGDLLSGF